LEAELRNFFLDHARMLLRDYRADGLRFDAAHEIQWECLDHIIRGIRAEPNCGTNISSPKGWRPTQRLVVRHQ